MPCLNEADTLATCIAQGAGARCASAASPARSSSPTTAAPTARRTSPTRWARGSSRCRAQGYGNALMGGIAAARGTFVIMGDADDSYDFLELPKFVEKLREGYDLVQGCRLAVGRRHDPARARCRCLHRWWGNPMFSAMVRRMVLGARSTTSTAGCAASRRRSSTASTSAAPGWSSPPRWSSSPACQNAQHRRGADHAAPGRPQGARAASEDLPRRLADAALLPDVQPALAVPVSRSVARALGLIGYAFALPGARIGGVHFDAHTLLFSSLAILLGHQSVVFAICAKTIAILEGLLPPNRRMERFYQLRHTRARPPRERGRTADWHRAARRSRESVAAPRLRRSRLHEHDAPGRPWRDSLRRWASRRCLASFLIGIVRTMRRCSGNRKAMQSYMSAVRRSPAQPASSVPKRSSSTVSAATWSSASTTTCGASSSAPTRPRRGSATRW